MYIYWTLYESVKNEKIPNGFSRTSNNFVGDAILCYLFLCMNLKKINEKRSLGLSADKGYGPDMEVW